MANIYFQDLLEYDDLAELNASGKWDTHSATSYNPADYGEDTKCSNIRGYKAEPSGGYLSCATTIPGTGSVVYTLYMTTKYIWYNAFYSGFKLYTGQAGAGLSLNLQAMEFGAYMGYHFVLYDSTNGDQTYYLDHKLNPNEINSIKLDIVISDDRLSFDIYVNNIYETTITYDSTLMGTSAGVSLFNISNQNYDDTLYIGNMHRAVIISDERIYTTDVCLGTTPVPNIPPGLNKSILFDGHESIANPPVTLSEVLADSAFTIEGWVKLPLNYYHVDDLIIADIKDKFSLYIEGTTGDLKFSHGATVEDLTDKLLDNERHYVTITSDKTTTKVWLNSYVVGEYTTTEVIGSTDIISICDFLGRGDNFAFYDKVLTEEQIKKHYGSGRCAVVLDKVTVNKFYMYIATKRVGQVNVNNFQCIILL